MKYKFIASLPEGVRLDSLDIDQKEVSVSRGNKIVLKGIFSTKEEAMAYAESLEIFKFIVTTYCESYEEEYDSLSEAEYFLSYTEAKEAAEKYANPMKPGFPPIRKETIYPEYAVEPIELDPEEYEYAHAYKYILFFDFDSPLCDSFMDDEEYFETESEAKMAALEVLDVYAEEEEIEDRVEIVVEPIPIENILIVAIED